MFAMHLPTISALIAFVLLAHPAVAQDSPLFRIEVRDAENDWPVPLVELRTVHNVRFVTDNAGVIAFDLPECFDREIFFYVSSHGYEVPADGFGYRGVRLTPRAGGTHVIKVQRQMIAKRLGRLSGAGLFAEAQRFGERASWKEGPVMGYDSVQMTLFGGRPFWNWGDTSVAHYPLGNFNMTGATTAGRPVEQLKPPIEPHYDYFLDEGGRPKGMAPIPGKGPTWLTGYAALPDAGGREHLVALYHKIEPPLATYELGLCEWDEQQKVFAVLRKLWSKSDGEPEPDPLPRGHAVRTRDPDGREWLLLGDPFPKFRCLATYEAWRDPEQWQAVASPDDLQDADSEASVRPHSGSIAWSAYRRRWVSVFMQQFGKPSAFGELWYAEAGAPTGPWGPATKVLTHANYTFYNPRLWGELATADSPVLLFEGTYTEQFAKNPVATPRYDYNQILYRLDLDDPKLGRSQVPADKQ
ncbi:MAG: hypothetical protein ACTHK7_02495 [Aureliella sp.]